MNKSYLNKLKREISVLPKSTQQQIMSDFKSYSEESGQPEKSEADLEREFGLPQDIAFSYMKEELIDSSLPITIYDKFLTELLSIVFLLTFLPLNIWLMTKGYYGDLPSFFENPTSMIFKALFTDPVNILAIIVGIVIAFRVILTNKGRYQRVTVRYQMTERILTLMPAILTVIAFFAYHGKNRYIVLGILVQTTVTAGFYILLRTLTTKKLA